MSLYKGWHTVCSIIDCVLHVLRELFSSDGASMLKMKSPTAFASVFALALGVVAVPARADLIFNLDTGNSAISGFSGPYASVDVHLIDTTHATVEFKSLTNSGNIYLM